MPNPSILITGATGTVGSEIWNRAEQFALEFSGTYDRYLKKMQRRNEGDER